MSADPHNDSRLRRDDYRSRRDQDILVSSMRDLNQSVRDLQKDFSTFKENLPELYLTRREGSEMHTRLTALEEWRLSETKRYGEQQISLEREIATAKTQSSRTIFTQRTELDSRLIGVLFGIGTVILGYLFNYFLTHGG
jgi:hypothetical protein